MAKIVTKNSSTASAVPTTSDLVQGELAVNVTDKRIFTENASTEIVELGTNPSSITTPSATVTGTLTANGTLASSNAVITGGSVNSTPIGATTPSTVTGSTVTATTGFVGGLTGNVTGNVTGNLTGNVTGNVTGDVTGNVTASTGTTTLNNLVVNGTADFTNTKLTNVVTPTAGTDAANKDYVDTSVAAVIDAAPAALDTLNELAAALGDDADFAGTVTTALATKLPLAGGTMTGAIAMGTSKITGLGDPTSAQDAATKTYVDTADALKLNLTGGTMSGAIAMGTNKITNVGDPTLAQDAATKAYTDSILGSATSAADSAAAASASASAASTSATEADGSATDAATSAVSASSSASAASASASAAATSEANSATSEANAAASEAAAAASEAQVSSDAAAAAASQVAAELAETNSETAQAAAEAAQLAAETAETNAATSESNAATSATASANSASAAATSAANAATSYDDFDDRYLGQKTSDPSVDNDGDALLTGALYYNTTDDKMKVYTGSIWQDVAPVATSITVSQISDYTGTVTELNYTDGVTSPIQTQIDTKLASASYTASDVLTKIKTVDGASSGLDADLLDGQEATAFATAAQGALADSAVQNLSDLSVTATAAELNTLDGITATTAELNYTDGVTSSIQTQLDSKLASSSYTASDVLTKVKTVDGAGSGLDADLLDGQQGSYYTGYADTAVANLVASAPSTLDTLNELAAALGDDPNFATTVTNSIATKAPIASPTFTGTVTIPTASVTGNITVTGTVDGRDVAADGTKLDGIESGATADQTAAEILTAVKTVDGTGSGLDADLLDGQQGSYYYPASNPNGYTTNVGDITGVTAGVGLSGGGTSGTVTVAVDLSELTDMTAAMVGTDEFIVLDAGADRRKAANEIGLSVFNNDSGFTTYSANQALDTTSSPSFAGVNINGNLNAVDSIYTAANIYHEGDTDTYIAFEDNQISMYVGASREVTISTTGVRLGDTGNGYFQPVTGTYGSIQIDAGAHGGYEGYSIGGRAVFMHDNSNSTGIYNDVDNEWLVNCVHNGAVNLYYNGTLKLSTTNTGASVNGTMSATAFTGDGSALTNLPASGGTIEATASGALANGDVVSLNSNGTVSVVQGNDTYAVTSGPTISSTFLEANNIYAAAYDPVQGKVVLIYNSVNSSRYGTAIVGTISGTTLTFGTPVTFWSTSGFQTQNIIYEPSSGKMVVVGYTGTGYGLTALVGTISGTSISFGTPNSFGYKPDFGSYAPGICLTGTANQVFVSWSGGDSPYGLFGAVGTISGTSISFGTSAVTASGARVFIDCDYHPVQNKILVTFREQDNSGYGSACVASISGTTVTFGTIYTFNSASTQSTKVMYHPPSGKMLLVYNYNAVIARVVTISGTTLTYGSTTTVHGSTPYYLTRNQGGFVGGGCYFSYAGSGFDGYVSKLGIEGSTVVELEPEYEFETTDFTLGCMAYDTGNNKIATFRYGNPSQTKVVTPVFTTADKFVGISDGAYSNGATATIQVVSSVDDAQSGLTAGEAYYVTPTGGLSATAGDPVVYAGRALSSTEILIKG